MSKRRGPRRLLVAALGAATVTVAGCEVTTSGNLLPPPLVDTVDTNTGTDAGDEDASSNTSDSGPEAQ